MMTGSPETDTLGTRRGACPTLSSPMRTGDGLLARIALDDRISPAQLSQLCTLSSRHGNGIIDVSARGNLQIRGLSDASALLLARDVRESNLPLRQGLAVEQPPFAGLDETEIADPRELVASIREGAMAITGIAPKASVVVDGKGRLRLSHLLADIRLVANPQAEGGGWTIMLGGTEASTSIYATMSSREAAAEVLKLLRELAELGPNARGRDLAAGLPRSTMFPSAASPFGLHTLADGQSAAGVGLPFGQISAERLHELCLRAISLGIAFAQPAIEHSVLFLGAPRSCRDLLDFAGQKDFLIAPFDPRGAIAVCSGSPACASAAVATHGLADDVVSEFGNLLDGSFKLHITGCPKGCAHPQPSPLALCGTAAGLSFISGRTTDSPFHTITRHEIETALRQLAAFIRREKRDEETSAACLSRLGSDALAANLTSGHP